jgi:hypothetical protein
MRFGLTILASVAFAATLGSAAKADGFPPFYGYSPYLGGPAVYFTPEEDVRAASIVGEGLPGMGTRTYYRGGPFFTYQSAKRARAYAPRHGRRRATLVTKG